MKRTLYAALVAATALSLQPGTLGDAHSSSTVIQSVELAVVADKVAVPQIAESFDLETMPPLPVTPAPEAVTVKKKRVAVKPKLPNKANPRIAKRALTVAQQMNTVGWCYKGVCTALRPLGINLSGAAAYEAKDQLLKDDRFTAFTINGVHDLKPGDILVHGASAQKPFGHIAVYLGNSNEASDHVQQVVLNGPYNGTTVFRYGTAVEQVESISTQS